MDNNRGTPIFGNLHIAENEATQVDLEGIGQYYTAGIQNWHPICVWGGLIW